MSRVVFSSLLSQRCTIETPAVSQAATGGPTRTWQSSHNNVACRLEAMSGVEKHFLGREGVEDVFTLFLPAFVTVTNKDRVDIGGTAYALESVEEVRGSRGTHHYECMAVKRS